MGWRSKDERDLVKWAQNRGWTMMDRNGRGHITMCWEKTGITVPVAGSTRSNTVANARKMFERSEKAIPGARA